MTMFAICTKPRSSFPDRVRNRAFQFDLARRQSSGCRACLQANDPVSDWGAPFCRASAAQANRPTATRTARRHPLAPRQGGGRITNRAHHEQNHFFRPQKPAFAACTADARELAEVGPPLIYRS